jgi:hypothetical protein
MPAKPTDNGVTKRESRCEGCRASAFLRRVEDKCGNNGSRERQESGIKVVEGKAIPSLALGERFGQGRGCGSAIKATDAGTLQRRRNSRFALACVSLLFQAGELFEVDTALQAVRFALTVEIAFRTYDRHGA